jgi:hypothetical protein
MSIMSRTALEMSVYREHDGHQLSDRRRRQEAVEATTT